MAPDLRPSPLTAHHRQAGARLAPFAGWQMPRSFAGTVAEHHAVRDDVGAFDVSHLGTVWIEGTDAVEVVAASFTNDPTRVAVGGSQYTLCCDQQAGILDDLIVYRVAPTTWLAVPNAANTATVVRRLQDQARDRDATVRDESGSWATVAVQGPRSLALVDEVLGTPGDGATSATELPYLGVTQHAVAGGPLLLCRTGYTGEVGVELVLPAGHAPATWAALLAAGAVPCGLGARDTLRLEMGYPLHGNELGPEVDPYEVRLGWAVKLDRGDFVGRAALVAAAEAPPARRLWGLRGHGRRPPRAGMAVSRSGADVGVVTSGSFSPTAEVGIGLALLDAAVSPGEEVTVDVRGTAVAFEVVRPPFVDRDPRGTAPR